MARLTTKKILHALMGAGLVDGYTVRKGGDFKDSRYTIFETVCEDVPPLRVSHESYGGRHTEMYFRCSDNDTANRVWDVLEGLGYTGRRHAFAWCNDRPNFLRVEVSPFKACNWWVCGW